MKRNDITRLGAFWQWVQLGFWVGLDTGEAFCMMLPFGLRRPFQQMAMSHEIAMQEGGGQNPSYFDQAGYLIFQALTYLGLYPARLVGRYFIGPLLGTITAGCFVIPGGYGAYRHSAPEVKQFDWFKRQAQHYAPVSIWGALGFSIALTALLVLGYLPNLTLTLPIVQSQWSSLGLIWTVPLVLSFVGLSVVGAKEWLMMTKYAIFHQDKGDIPLKGIIQTLQLSDKQKEVLLVLFRKEHQHQQGNGVLFAPNGVQFNQTLLHEQLQFAKAQVGQSEENFESNLTQRRARLRK